MKQVATGRNGNNLVNNATRYNPLFFPDLQSGYSATATDFEQIIPSTGKLRNLKVKIDAVAGAAKSYTFTVMVNGVASSLAVTISGATDTRGLDTDEISVSAGDRVNLRTTASGTPTATPSSWSVEYESDTAQRFIVMGASGGNVDAAGTRYNALFPRQNIWQSASTTYLVRSVAPIEATIKSFYVNLNGSPGAGKSYAISIMKNNSEEASSIVTIADAATSGNVTGLSINVARGDYFTIKVTPTGTPTARQVRWGVEFQPDTDGESFISSSTDHSFGTDHYAGMGSVPNDGGTESQVKGIVGPTAYVIKDLYVKLLLAPGASKSTDVYFRVNGSSTALSASISGTNTVGEDTTDEITPAENDEINFFIDNVNTPAHSGELMSVIQYIAPGGGDVTTPQTITGKARIEKAVSQTVTGKARIQKAVTQTIAGLARITTSVARTINGVANINNNTLQTITGKARVQKAVTQTIQGIARITVSTLQTIQGKASILKSTTQNVQGVARIEKNVTQIVQGVSRIQKAVTQTIQGVARITASASQVIQGKARITASTSQTMQGKASILKSVSRTIDGVASIVAGATRDITGVARITASTLRTVTGKASILKAVTQTIQGTARIQKSVTQTVQGVARIAKDVTQTITGKSRIEKSVAQTVTGLARIEKAVTQLITGLARITASTSQAIQGKARIEKSVTQTITGKSRVEKSTAQNIVGVSRLQKAVSQLITGLARIQTTPTQTIQGTSRIEKSQSQIITGVSKISAVVQRTITGKASVLSPYQTQTISGKAYILKRRWNLKRVVTWYSKNTPIWSIKTNQIWYKRSTTE
ncbi:MAG TPA: hypothetical protein VD999_05765 [Vitreimonas sp.]|nr:hypothetical protein [Vitreimonas sp.]